LYPIVGIIGEGQGFIPKKKNKRKVLIFSKRAKHSTKERHQKIIKEKLLRI